MVLSDCVCVVLDHWVDTPRGPSQSSDRNELDRSPLHELFRANSRLGL